MKSVSVKKLRTELPDILKRVEQGEAFVIIYHSKPVGEIIPLKRRQSNRKATSLYDLLEKPFGEITLPEELSSVAMVRADRR